MKKLLIVILCSTLLLTGCMGTKYKRISFESNALSDDSSPLPSENAIVINNSGASFPGSLPIYEIKERNIQQTEYEQLLEALGLPSTPADFELEGNHLYYSLAEYTDFSRGYFDMTDEELEDLAWYYFNKIPFLEGEYEYLGIRSTTTLSDKEGHHKTRVGVSFNRVLSDTRVIGNNKCDLFFDGSGLVAISITLFDYTQIGTMQLVPLNDATAQLKTPDDFDIQDSVGLAEKLQIDNIVLRLVNQHSRGCTILQPVYYYTGKATCTDSTEREFSAKIIAIPESYTYE